MQRVSEGIDTYIIWYCMIEIKAGSSSTAGTVLAVPIFGQAVLKKKKNLHVQLIKCTRDFDGEPRVSKFFLQFVVIIGGFTF